MRVGECVQQREREAIGRRTVSVRVERERGDVGLAGWLLGHVGREKERERRVRRLGCLFGLDGSTRAE